MLNMNLMTPLIYTLTNKVGVTRITVTLHLSRNIVSASPPRLVDIYETLHKNSIHFVYVPSKDVHKKSQFCHLSMGKFEGGYFSEFAVPLD